MDRRGFLKGTFGGVTSAGILIAAGDTDLDAFAKESKVGEVMGVAPLPIDIEQMAIGRLLYDNKGNIVAVVQQINHYLSAHDASGWGDSASTYMRGLSNVRIIATAYGPGYMRMGDPQ